MEDSDRYWIKQFIYFSDKGHPNRLGGPEVVAFLNALVFLYDSVLHTPLGELAGLKPGTAAPSGAGGVDPGKR